jgi:hypothetical protein
MLAFTLSRPRLLLALVLLATGCGAGWRSLTGLEPGSLRPRQQAQLWQDQKAQRVHGVVVGQDSISGIPFAHPLECDSCRITLPRSQVDSVRVGSPVAGFWKSVGVVSAGVMIACVMWCIQPGT